MKPAEIFNKVVSWFHLWLGLVTGIVVLIVSVTGCIYVFQEEISRALRTGVWIPVERQERPYATTDTYIASVVNNHPGELMSVTFDIFYRRSDAVIAWARDTDRSYTAYILNPYSGEILRSLKYSVSFWAVVLHIHVSLGIPVVGSEIVAASTLIFLLLLITGIILWWPKKKSEVKRSFWFMWTRKTKGKRMNYDLHNVLGFYTFIALFFITVSALTMSYGWMDKGIAWMTNIGYGHDGRQQWHSGTVQQPGADTTFAATYDSLLRVYGPLERSFLSFNMKHDSVLVSLFYLKGATYNRHDVYKVSKTHGKIFSFRHWTSRANSEIYKEAELNLHVGSILGLPGKILAFISSLVAASLPVTGLYIWLNRKRKKKRHRRVPT